MKVKLRSFKMKLWLYFVFFTALIFTVLWLLQTVFIQSFYNEMLISNTKAAAEQIAVSYTEDNSAEIIDKISLSNSLLVYIADSNGTILYCSDQFRGLSGKNHGKEQNSRHSAESIRRPEEYRSLPDDFDLFLESLEASENRIYEKIEDGLYIYGAYIDGETEQSILYISTVLEAVGPAVDIIRLQLVWGTVLSLIIGFILAWFIARGFARPVARLTKKAEHIGEDDFPQEFRKGFCSELDELSDVLDETSDKLRKSRDFQRELLANVSHDLRTPLTMIKGYAEMVRDFSRTDEQQCNDDIEVIVREADRLSAMVNEILEYSAMQSAEQLPALETIDFSAVVRRVCGNFDSLYSREGGHIRTDITENIMVNGNIGRLERAVYNLLDNAVRHNGENKVVEGVLYLE